jgi:hypothetical protein
MGCDIHSQAERRVDGKWTRIEGLEPFDWRSYGMYGFLANVRNYSDVTPISEARGLPVDADYVAEESEHWLGDHSFSWLSLNELLAFDYDQPMEDRRVSEQIAPNVWSGAGTAQPGGGKQTTYRDFLGEGFFEELEKLKTVGAERIVFGFDS